MTGRARDIVFVHGLEAFTVIGVFAHERTAPRRLVLDIDVACDASQAAREDDLARAVDYDALAKGVVRHVATLEPRLLETLAEEVARRLLETLRAPWVRVKVVKPGVVPGAQSVGVVIERGERPAAAGPR